MLLVRRIVRPSGLGRLRGLAGRRIDRVSRTRVLGGRGRKLRGRLRKGSQARKNQLNATCAAHVCPTSWIHISGQSQALKMRLVERPARALPAEKHRGCSHCTTLQLYRNAKAKRATLFTVAFEPEFAAVSSNNLAANGKAETRAWNFLPMQPLKGFKDLLMVSFINSLPVIADRDDVAVSVFLS